MINALYVDDEPSLLNIVKTYMELEGDIEMDIENSPKEALVKIKSKQYDAIISDYSMPEMNGVELLKKIRMDNNLTPFIFFSATNLDELESGPIPSGVNIYIQKDADVRSVFEILVSTVYKVAKESE